MCSEPDSLEPGAAPAKTPEYCHRNVPRKQDLRVKSTAASQDGALPTTLMIRNIPNRYCQQDLIDELEGLGLAGIATVSLLNGLVQIRESVPAGMAMSSRGPQERPRTR